MNPKSGRVTAKLETTGGVFIDLENAYYNIYPIDILD